MKAREIGVSMNNYVLRCSSDFVENKDGKIFIYTGYSCGDSCGYIDKKDMRYIGSGYNGIPDYEISGPIDWL